ncbi:hypothetical protein [Herpetosiphon gulosus]|uniref:Uncharacterized protein n=1 Tax=Herpetosiphon gulosus TaxID=1973496 RepID=A0ABP9X438_9CHLR
MPNLIVNGREYRSVDEMSTEDRQLYQQTMGLLGDHDGDGVPDIFNQPGKVQAVNLNQQQINLTNGANDQLKQVFVDRDGNGIPDILEGQTNFGNPQSNFGNPQTTNSSTTWKTAAPTADPLGGSPLPWNQPQQNNGFMLGLVVGGVVIGAALLIWLLLL